MIKDSIIPTVSSNTIAANTYTLGDQIDVVLTFNEVVDFTGTPTIDLGLDSGVVTTTAAAGSGTNTVTLSYTVQSGDEDIDGNDKTLKIKSKEEAK